jgi:hypothetical protein
MYKTVGILFKFTKIVQKCQGWSSWHSLHKEKRNYFFLRKNLVQVTYDKVNAKEKYRGSKVDGQHFFPVLNIFPPHHPVRFIKAQH